MENLPEIRLKSERQQTDNSLTVERKKTDDSFENYNETAEDRTDLVIEEGRKKADDARRQRRANADIKVNTHDKNPEQNDNLINAERKIEDTEIKNERSRMDMALDHEREEKEILMAQLLKYEREQTDKNLSVEREKSDLDATRSAKVLKNEKTAHSETRAALTTKEEFIAIVSHDLRNPIGTIFSVAEILLEDKSFVDISHEARRWIEIIKRNASISLHLISDILDMERVVEGKIQLRLGKYNINNVISEVIESYKVQAHEKSISVKLDPLMTFDNFEFDRDRITQVLSNLIGNALKFTPANGCVSVGVRELEDEVEISVKDTGPGIPEDQRSRIFEKFVQIDDKRRTGIGLGLYIAKTLVECHGGKIWATSDSGLGSKFVFTLPKPDVVAH